MKNTYIKIYGLQRSGTNYTEWVCNNNFSNVIVLKHGNILGWKHGPPVAIDDIDWSGKNWDNQNHDNKKLVQDRIDSYLIELESLGGKDIIINAASECRLKNIFCIRNPYSWYASKGPKWSGFHNNVSGAIKHWNMRNSQYLEFIEKDRDNSVFLTHWESVNSFDLTVSKISSIGLKYVDTLINQDRSVDCGEWDAEIGAQFNREKYRDRKWFLNNLDRGTISNISQHVDREIMDFLGMEIL